MAVPTADLAGSDGPLLEVVKQGPLAIDDKVFSRDRPARARQRRADQHDHGLAAALRHGARRASCRASFGAVRTARRTPFVAIVFTTALAIVLILTGDLGDLADTTVLLLLVVFASSTSPSSSCAATRSTTTTSARPRRSR